MTEQIEFVRIDASVRPPEPGLIVKGWNNGAVWAGYYNGSPKMASCDWWFPIPDGVTKCPS